MTVVTKYIPKRYGAINFMGILFYRRGAILNSTEKNHLRIHAQQMRELFYVFYYIINALDYICMLLGTGFSPCVAKQNTAFELEAYFNEKDRNYLSKRKRFSWFKYVF